jgi:monofunctional biosynthetic peptidoglycan transglycosylase
MTGHLFVPLSRAAAALLLSAVAVLALSKATALEEPMLIFDFSEPEAVSAWYSIGDRVMGGVSSGRMHQGEGFAVFEGEVSLENNGGFFSVRSEPRALDLSDHDGIALKVRGDGQRYKIGLKTDSGFDGIVYRAGITPPAGAWTTLRVPFEEFEPVFRGARVRGAPALAADQVRSLGLLISDKQAGPFRLEVAWIGAYGPADTTQTVNARD